jgi:RNA polymerase sigma-70 factor (ECF subfamily)
LVKDHNNLGLFAYRFIREIELILGKKGRQSLKRKDQAPGGNVPASATPNPLGLPAEDPLEALLDEVSDEEFGAVSIRDNARLDSGERIKLAQWTAQDFSSVYVRFRPHLERHARRFLSNQSQVDEVVQDAFLYLMVSLPELDSEIGVLRFLKWKTRLLAIDVIRASGRAYLNSIDEVPEPEALGTDVSAHLEQQDDAAVVKLALSKLNPRHREVLIASMYEEKSTEQIASQVGLSENATRQLIFRARAAFKKALVGDVDTTGMSAARILSVAARKAASESKKIGAAAMAILGIFALSLALIPGLQNTPSDQMAEVSQTPDNSSSNSNPSGPDSGSSEPSSSAPGSSGSENAEPGNSETGTAGSNSSESATSEPGNQAAQPEAPTSSSLTPSRDLARVPASTSLSGANSGNRFFFNDQALIAYGKNGESVSLIFNPNKDNFFSNVSFAIKSSGFALEASPKITNMLMGQNSNGQDVYLLTGTSLYAFDSKQGKWISVEGGEAAFSVAVTMNNLGSQVLSVDFEMAPAAK